MKIFILSFLSLLFFSPSIFALDMSNLDRPESIIVDKDTGYYYISNVNGEPLDKDGNGYISKVSSDGLVAILKFIESKSDAELHAPKGMAIVEGVLYVSDIDVVRGFDLNSGQEVKVIGFEEYEPEFLNDLATDRSGNIYVSDMMKNRIFKVNVKQDEVVVFKEGEELGMPNGLLFNPNTNKLIVASWQGSLYEIDSEGKIEVLKTDLDGLDGVTVTRRGELYVSSFSVGEIYSIPNWGHGDLMLYKSGLTTPADIFIDRAKNLLLVPLMHQDSLTSFSLEV